MKIDQTTTMTTAGLEGFETQTFTLEASGKAFKILLDGLYSNKIGTVIRELWTNAFDSHLAAGIGGVPFDCHLPSPLDPTFRVRDYGVSLTHEQVMHLYTRVFKSTKEDTNDQVGALGLGSKSPFAYTDTFTVVARLDGVKRTYLASFDGVSAPQILCLSIEDSDEAQGLEVILPARVEDFNRFAEEAKILSVGFDPLPQVDGIEIEPYEPEYVGRDGSFAVFRPHVLPGSGQLAIRQGCVIYPVDNYELTAPVGRILHTGYRVIIDVPIGDVAVTASREALSLDERTMDNVKRAVKNMTDVITAEIYSEADQCRNTLEAVTFWFGDGRDRTFQITPKWRGKEVRNFIELKGGSDWETPTVRRGKRKEPIKLKGLSLQDTRNVKVVTHYTDRKVLRANARYRDLIDSRHYGVRDYTYMLVDPSPRLLERMMTLWGLTPQQIVWIGELPDPGPPLRLNSGPSVKGALMGVTEVTGRESWKRVTSLESDFYWIPVERISKEAIRLTMSDFSAMRQLGFPDKTVYAFTPGAEKRHSPQRGRVLSDAIKEWKAKNEQGALDTIENYLFGQAVISAGLKDMVKFTEVDYAASQAAINLVGGRYGAKFEGAERKAQLRIDQLEKDYPLLFVKYTAPEPADVKWYVEARNRHLGK